MIARPEDELAGVVIELWLVDPDHFPPRVRVNDVRVARRDLPFGDNALMVEGGGMRNGEIGRAAHRFARVSVKLAESGAARISEPGMKSEAKQTALVVIWIQHDQPARNIKERRGPHLPI